GNKGYSQMFSEFASDRTWMDDVFDPSSLDRVRDGIANALGLSVGELQNERTLKRRLRGRGLSTDDLGQMLVEGLSDVGGKGFAPAAGAVTYDDSMERFGRGVAKRISDTATQEAAGNIKIGSWNSDIGEQDAALLARLKSLSDSTNTRYVVNGTKRARMEADVNAAHGRIAGSQIEATYNQRLEIYKRIHNNADLI
ncbi:MAG: hypothetical protein PHG85_06560, partial [Candidatus Altiarchaeota archaeon]|nr:hypothetical protein [Candidatus Altiarchaeota archaeon]